MPELIENYAFDDFPRQPLPEMVSRRELFSAILTKLRVESSKNQGRRVLSLSDLGEAPDDKLSPMIPVMVNNSSISIKDEFVLGSPPRSDMAYKLFPLHSPALTAFNLINGSNSLQQISEQLAKQTGWEQARCFAYTRGLFLTLVVAGLCLPKNG
jgi:hypothetical protein